jgi:protein-tyrosine-phosphatase
MNVLFICKHNRFRSKVAEAFFNFYKKEDDKVRSRGVKIDRNKNFFVSENTIEMLKEKKLKIANKEAKLIDAVDINWADKIIIVADDVDSKIFPKKKTIVWGVEDCAEDDIQTIKKRINMIEKLVKDFCQNP